MNFVVYFICVAPEWALNNNIKKKVVKMEHYLRVAGVVGVKNVRETKDKQGMPSGKCSITASYEGGKIEFMVPKEMGVVVGDELKIEFDATPQMVRMDFGSQTVWRDGFVIGDIVSLNKVQKKA